MRNQIIEGIIILDVFSKITLELLQNEFKLVINILRQKYILYEENKKNFKDGLNPDYNYQISVNNVKEDLGKNQGKMSI